MVPRAPAISLPTGGGAIRGIGEKFAANPVTGTGTGSVPIPTSPGRSGFGPELGLAYDSGNGNGPFGIGWKLSLPAITRKTDKGLPRYQDTMDDGDVFVLSGSEDLVPEPGHNLTRQQGDRRFAVRRYRPRIEGPFARIEHWRDLEDGQTHWRAISRENITTVYGSTALSRIADPADPSRVFSWLVCESFDALGNAMLYEYKPEDSRGVDTSLVHEATRTDADRTAQRYLKRIKYGNRRSRLTAPILSTADYMFEVVFDYGEHDTGTPAEDRDWDVRADPFSSYRSGFEVRGYRLCRRVLMFHHFPDDTDVGADCLVRATELDYRTETIGSFIASVTQRGYRRQGDEQVSRALPRVDFDYSRAVIDETPRTLPADSLANLPQGVEGPGYQWVDLDGEGLSGVLSQQGTGLFYKPNLGDGHFGPVRQLPSQPSTGVYDSPRLLDLAGDGSLDVVDLASATPGFYERTEDGGWRTFRPFASMPNLDPNDPNLRFVDLTGDGFADVMITEDDVFTWHPSLGEDGYGAAMRTHPPLDEAAGPRLVFAHGEDGIHLADMSGDGLSDMVRVRNGEVCYWPNLGYGRFGPRVTMDESPWLDEPESFDQQRVRLADIDGSGCVDLIYLHRTETRVYRNRCGNTWEPPQGLGVAFPRTDQLAQVSATDLLGNGTACLVWSSPLPTELGHHVRYLDLMGSVKPHLLTSVVNNMGAETRVGYAPSTRFYLDDQRDGHPWITKLPFPVHVVERVETIDHISHNRFVSRFAYHHGFFDGVEREFHGFAMVEQWDTESFAALGQAPNVDEVTYLPPVHTKTWFHTGADLPDGDVSGKLATEYFPDAIIRLPDSTLPTEALTPDERRQALRALKGTTLRRETYAADDSPAASRPYLTASQNYTVKLHQAATGPLGYAVFSIHDREQLTAQYERSLADPRVSHEVVLAVDDFGNVLRSAAIGYGRLTRDPSLSTADQARQSRTHVVYTETDYTNLVDTDNDYRVPLSFESSSFKLNDLDPNQAFDVDSLNAAVSTADRKLLRHSRNRYRRDDLSGPLPLGVLESRALPQVGHQKIFTERQLTETYGDRVDEAVLRRAGYERLDGDSGGGGDDGWWSPSSTVFYSVSDDPAVERYDAIAHFFQPCRFRDPFGGESTIDYDAYDLLVTGTRDQLANETSAVNDYRVLSARLSTDANGNRSAVAFDALGMVVGTAVMGKDGEGVGDSLDGFAPDLTDAEIDGYFHDPLADPHALLGDATTRMVYDQFAYFRTRHDSQPRPPVVATLSRETHAADLEDGEPSRLQHSLSYSDGFTREIQHKAQAEPGPDGQPRWTGTGWTVFNNKGKPVRKYEPFFSATHDFEFAVLSGVSSVQFYDPLGRTVATIHPNDTWEKLTFDAWYQATWDVNDTVLIDPRTDADIGGYVRGFLAAQPDWRTWYEQRVDGALGEYERAAARKTEAHAATPGRAWLDGLGRAIVSLADNRDETFATRTILDIEGSILEVSDALDRVVVRYEYDLVGVQIGQESMDTGRRLLLNDVAGQPVLAWNSRGLRFRTEYDALRRPVRMFVADGEDAEVLFERFEYGESHPEAAQRNLRTRLYRHYDTAGIAATPQFDFKGNALTTTRQLAVDYREDPDWAGDVPLQEAVYASHTAFDALNRATRLTAPDGSQIVPGYNEANLLERLDATLAGADAATAFVTGIDYNARGQRQSIEYGNGVRTEYDYDDETFRLTTLRTVRGSTTLQDLTHTYDPIGNITHIADAAQSTVFNGNQRVEASADYTFDATYRLVEATGREQIGAADDGGALGRYLRRFGYDQVGNLLSMTHRATDPAKPGWTRRYRYAEASLLEPGVHGNRLSAITDNGPTTPPRFDYDEHGNTTAMPELPSLRWDFKDRLRSSARQGETEQATTFYVYDSNGNRVRKATEHHGVQLSERVYLGPFEIHRKYRANGELTLERQTLHILDGEHRIALVERRTQGEDDGPAHLTRFQLANQIGSSTLELDDSARIISYEEYYPYGGTAVESVRSRTETPKRYRYTGKERDEESGLYYHGARYYAPGLGRWTSGDPKGIAEGPNPYVYTRNNPIVFADPDGREARLIINPVKHTVTVRTTVHLYAATDAERTALREVAKKAEAYWANPTVATESEVNTAVAAKTSIPNRGTGATINNQQWTLNYDIKYQVHDSPTAPIKIDKSGFVVDEKQAAADKFEVGDNVLTLRAPKKGEGIGGRVEHLATNYQSRREPDGALVQRNINSHMVGEVIANSKTESDKGALLRRLIHETGHTIGMDERYYLFQGGYPGFANDVMAADDGYATRVIDPRHITEYLNFAVALMTRASPGATGPHTFLLSTFIDDTQRGRLNPSDSGYAAAQTAAQAAAVTETLWTTVLWLRSQTAGGKAIADLLPHIPSGFVNAKPQPQPQGVGEGLIPR